MPWHTALDPRVSSGSLWGCQSLSKWYSIWTLVICSILHMKVPQWPALEHSLSQGRSLEWIGMCCIFDLNCLLGLRGLQLLSVHTSESQVWSIILHLLLLGVLHYVFSLDWNCPCPFPYSHSRSCSHSHSCLAWHPHCQLQMDQDLYLGRVAFGS